MNPVWNYAADFPIEEASGLDIKIEASCANKMIDSLQVFDLRFIYFLKFFLITSIF